MCELCNGSHVFYKITSLSASVIPCPVCGPMDPQDWEKYWKNVEQSIEEAAQNFELEEAR